MFSIPKRKTRRMTLSVMISGVCWNRSISRISYAWILILCGVIHVTCVTAFWQGTIIRERLRLHKRQGLNPPYILNKIGGTRICMSMQEVSDAEDEKEWQALISAFQMYKAAYGDLKVPGKFIVPAMPPWPKNAWGLKLGHRVAAIRATGMFVRNSEEKRKVLNDMGFLWRLRSTRGEKNLSGISMQQIVDAINTYKEQNNIEDGTTFSVPTTFIVPDNYSWPMSTRGMPLGKKITSMKTKTYQKNNEEKVQKLKDLGILFDGLNEVNNSRFQRVLNALKTYKEINGDLLVPQPFVVPEDASEWPKDTWGLRLGARVNAIRSQGTFVNTNPDRRAILNELGFVWNPPPSERGRKRGRRKKSESTEEDPSSEGDLPQASQESTIAAMDNLFGPSYEFGGEDEGKNEGSTTWAIDGQSDKIETVDSSEDQVVNVINKPNLRETLMEIGRKAKDAGVIEEISEDGVRKKGKQYKKIPLYNDDFGEDFVFADVVEALVTYKKIHGTFSNFTRGGGTDFIIPESEMEAFGNEFLMEDSGTVASARAATTIAAYEEEYDISERENLIAAEINRLQEEVESDSILQLESGISSLSTREEFLDPEITKMKWPQHLAGMKLGHIIRRIKDGSLEVKHLPERKAILDAIDFDWGEEKYFLNVPFEKAMCSFYAYYMVRGDMFVWDDFVMPDEDPWPISLAGYKIGKAVKQIRELQNFIEAYHPDKVQMLRMVDFVWFPSLALPLDPTAGGLTMEQKFCQFYGHPNYYELPEMPPTLMEKIFENGPVTNDDDPQLWYKQYYDWDYVKDLWYDLGCRDRAFALERRGYPICAAEHAEKYGTGYYEDLLGLLDEIGEITPVQFDNLDDESKIKLEERLRTWRGKLEDTIDFDEDEVTEILEKIDYYLTDPDDRLPDEPGDEIETEDVFEDDGDSNKDLNDLANDITNKVEDEKDMEDEDSNEDETEDKEEESVMEGEDGFEEDAVNVEDELGLGD